MAAATGAGTKELMHRLGHASPRAALRYQYATAKREEVIAEGMDRLLEAARTEPNSKVLPFRGRQPQGLRRVLRARCTNTLSV